MTCLKMILGFLVGLLAAGVVIAIVEYLGHIAMRGDATFFVTIVGYLLGSVVGTAIARRFTGTRVAVAIPAILGLLAVLNLYTFPHPSWFAIAATIALLLGGWIGDLWGHSFQIDQVGVNDGRI